MDPAKRPTATAIPVVGAADYLRATLGWPTKDALTKLGIAPFGLGSKYFTAGKKVDLKLLLSQVLGPLPGANETLGAMNLNPYGKPDLLQSLLEGDSGFRYTSSP